MDCFVVVVRSVRSTHLYSEIQETQWPIVYSSEYNISFLGMEKLHPFDAAKWGNIIGFLKGWSQL